MRGSCRCGWAGECGAGIGLAGWYGWSLGWVSLKGILRSRGRGSAVLCLWGRFSSIARSCATNLCEARGWANGWFKFGWIKSSLCFTCSIRHNLWVIGLIPWRFGCAAWQEEGRLWCSAYLAYHAATLLHFWRWATSELFRRSKPTFLSLCGLWACFDVRPGTNCFRSLWLPQSDRTI